MYLRCYSCAHHHQIIISSLFFPPNPLLPLPQQHFLLHFLPSVFPITAPHHYCLSLHNAPSFLTPNSHGFIIFPHCAYTSLVPIFKTTVSLCVHCFQKEVKELSMMRVELAAQLAEAATQKQVKNSC